MIRSVHFIDTGFFKLDGGAMFGVVPKSMWNKLNASDDNNMCTWSMRCLLIQTDDRKILVDAGMGDKQDERFRSHFYPHGDANLSKSLISLGVQNEDITDVFLTHLHFDHCGGAVSRRDGHLIPTFPKAKYWSNQKHWSWALNPNERERASFLKENFVPLQEHGVIHFVDNPAHLQDWIPELQFFYCYGHTEALMVLHFEFNQNQYVYPSDLIPSSHHVGIPYIMAYDVRPLDTLKEKTELLHWVLEEDAKIIYEHDPALAISKIQKNEQGKIQLKACEPGF